MGCGSSNNRVHALEQDATRLRRAVDEAEGRTAAQAQEVAAAKTREQSLEAEVARLRGEAATGKDRERALELELETLHESLQDPSAVEQHDRSDSTGEAEAADHKRDKDSPAEAARKVASAPQQQELVRLREEARDAARTLELDVARLRGALTPGSDHEAQGPPETGCTPSDRPDVALAGLVQDALRLRHEKEAAEAKVCTLEFQVGRLNGALEEARVASKAPSRAEHSRLEDTAEPRTQAAPPESEQHGTDLATLLRQGDIAVVRGSYFEECWRRRQPFEARAALPTEATIDGAEAAELWLEYGYAFLVLVSCAWLASSHPDPQCFHLQQLVRALRAFRAHHEGHIWQRRTRLCELGGGVILDFCSLRPGQEALHLLHVAYSHRDVTALKLTAAPSEASRGYHDCGWALLESALMDAKLPSLRSAHGNLNVLTCAEAEGRLELREMSRAARQPPLTPERFREELERRRQRAEAKGVSLFVKGRDASVALECYGAAFLELSRASGLVYTSVGWGAAEARELARTLPSFSALQKLNLNRNELGNEAAAFAELAQGLSACPALQELHLENNSLGGKAAEGLAMALPHFRILWRLWLADNRLGESMALLAASLPRCPALRVLDLSRNHLEDAGSLAAVLPECRELQSLFLGGNVLDIESEEALREAWCKEGGLVL